MEKEKIILTFDLEYWFESLSVQKYITGKEQESLSGFIDRLLNLLKKTNSNATFFISGKILDREPELVKKVNQAGNKVAIHSSDHKPLWDKTPDQFDKEIQEMIAKIETITGQKPTGHRAVSFSLNQKTKWMLKILVKNGIKYDSSIFPFKLSPVLLPMFKNYLYGSKINNFSPYRIDLDDPHKKNANSPLVEIPVAVYHWWKFKFPLSGGIYIRLIPFWLFNLLLRKKAKKEIACLYFHPLDFLDRAPYVNMPKFKKFIKFYNTKNTFKKLEDLLEKYNSISIEQYFYENSFYQPSHN